LRLLDSALVICQIGIPVLPIAQPVIQNGFVIAHLKASLAVHKNDGKGTVVEQAVGLELGLQKVLAAAKA
jgi:hypothetical protein